MHSVVSPQPPASLPRESRKRGLLLRLLTGAQPPCAELFHPVPAAREQEGARFAHRVPTVNLCGVSHGRKPLSGNSCVFGLPRKEPLGLCGNCVWSTHNGEPARDWNPCLKSQM